MKPYKKPNHPVGARGLFISKLLSLAAVLGCSLGIAGATTTLSVTNTPVPDDDDISQLTIKTWSWTGINLAGNNEPVGNTFVTGSNAGGYVFDSLSVNLLTAPDTGGSFIIAIYTLDTTAETTFAINVFSATTVLTSVAAAEQYLTFTSTDGFVLAPDTAYAFTIHSVGGDDVAFGHNGVDDAYVDGIAIRVFGNGAVEYGARGDMTFNLGLTAVAVPEPASLALVALGGGLLLRRRRA